MADNILLQIPNSTFNAGVMKILSYTSTAVRRFGGKYKNKATFYSDKIEITYNEWQENLSKYKAPTGTTMMSYTDLGRGKTVKQLIDLTEHGVASDLISRQQMKQAMGSPETMAEFIADRIDQAASRAQYEIDKLFLKQITDPKNYRLADGSDASDLNKSPAIFLNDEDEYKPLHADANSGVTTIRKLVSSVKSTAAAMKNPTNRFNKLKLMSNSIDFKRMGVIISEELFGQLEDLYGNTFNYEYAKFERLFAWVEVLPIHEYKVDGKHDGVHLILVSEDGIVCEIDPDSDSGWDSTRRIFQEEWWYQWVYAYQAVAHGKNIAMWGVKPATAKPTTAPNTGGSGS